MKDHACRLKLEEERLICAQSVCARAQQLPPDLTAIQNAKEIDVGLFCLSNIAPGSGDAECSGPSEFHSPSYLPNCADYPLGGPPPEVYCSLKGLCVPSHHRKVCIKSCS